MRCFDQPDALLFPMTRLLEFLPTTNFFEVLLRSHEVLPHDGALCAINVTFVYIHVDPLDYRFRVLLQSSCYIFRVSRCACCPICYRGLVGRLRHIVYLYPLLLPYTHAFFISWSVMHMSCHVSCLASSAVLVRIWDCTDA